MDLLWIKVDGRNGRCEGVTVENNADPAKDPVVVEQVLRWAAAIQVGYTSFQKNQLAILADNVRDGKVKP